MKRVALVGFSPTMRYAHDLDPEVEIWTGNYAWDFDLPKIDRLFEMHSYWWLEAHAFSGFPEKIRTKLARVYRTRIGKRVLSIAENNGRIGTLEINRDYKHFAWLHQDHDFPIIMKEVHEGITSSVEYPYQEIIEFIFGKMLRVEEPIVYLTSSMSFMLAMAIYEGYEQIYIYGVDMGRETEYGYQKGSCEWLMGHATGRGIEVIIPEECQLVKGKVYSYDGDAQMISRQALERHATAYQNLENEAIGYANKVLGKYEMAQEQLAEGKITVEEVQKLGNEVRVAREQHRQIMGARQSVELLIKEIDVEEPVLVLQDDLMTPEMATA